MLVQNKNKVVHLTYFKQPLLTQQRRALLGSIVLVLLSFFTTNPTISNGRATQYPADEKQSAGIAMGGAVLNMFNDVVSESNGPAEFLVTRSGALFETVTVSYMTVSGTAQSDVDFQAVSGVLTFNPFVTQETIPVPILPDALYEEDETFFVALFDPGNNAVIQDSEGEGTILDDDDLPEINIENTSVTEGNTGNVTAVFPVTLSAASGLTVTVSYETSDDTAIAGLDYVAASGTATIPAGETSTTIEITVLPDTKDEFDETFFVNLSQPENADPGDMEGVGTIVDNDPPPSISIEDVTVVEGDAGNVTATFIVSLSAESGKTVSVLYATEDESAVAGVDYQATSGMLTFPPGDTSETIEVTVLGDLLDEYNETFLVNLSAPVNASPGDMEGVGTIIDNDSPPGISIGDVTVTEGNAGNVMATFNVSLSAESGKTVFVSYATEDGTAVAGEDYQATSGMLTIPPGDTSATIEVTVLGDLLGEDDETFLVNLSAPVNASPGDMQGVGTIADDDDPVIGINDVPVAEGNSGNTVATFVVSLSAVSGNSVTVSYATADGTAEAGEDYETASGTLTIPAGDSSGTIEVTVLGDLIDEPAAETFLVNLSNPQNATIGDGVGVGTIADDDGLPALFMDGVTVDETAGMAGFSVTLIPASSFTVQVMYSTQDQSARAGQDYTTKNGTLTLNPGQTQATIAVPIQDDALDEDNETFLLVLSNPINAELGMAQEQGTILDNDPLPTLAIDDIAVSEIDGAALFTVKLNVVSGREVRVNYATSNGTAISGVDFEARSGTLVIPAGSGQGMVEVPLNPDLPLAGEGVEGNEAFFITLSNPYRATIAHSEAEATVIDNALFMPMSKRSADPCTSYEPNDSFVQASDNADITDQEGAVILGAFCADDPNDFYRIQVTTTAPEQTIQVNLGSVPANTDLDLYLYDSTGSIILVFSNTGLEGEAEEIVYEIPASGEHVYYILIHPYVLGYDASESYQLIWFR